MLAPKSPFACDHKTTHGIMKATRITSFFPRLSREDLSRPRARHVFVGVHARLSFAATLKTTTPVCGVAQVCQPAKLASNTKTTPLVPEESKP